ncbi:CPCC family cysteine-rich protein [Streptomyces sp. NBC_00597]|uniref:CPCC family cysteine-rich protein n=1 Tax=unclassified Streptomyces TaxID=2593676 RepID=UPI00352FDCF5
MAGLYTDTCPCCGHIVLGAVGSWGIYLACFWEDGLPQLRWPTQPRREQHVAGPGSALLPGWLRRCPWTPVRTMKPSQPTC